MKKNYAAIVTLVLLCTLLGSCASAPAPAGDKPKTQLTDGSYTATVKSHGGELAVEVVCADGKLDKVSVISHNDTPEYIGKVLDALPQSLVKSQSLEVDAVSGATLSSQAIKAAVAQCIRDAGGNPREYGYMPMEELSAKQEITFKGLPNGDKTYTGEQIKTFAAMETAAVSVNASGTETPLTCKGALLETVLNDCGVSQKDYGSIILTASDGYSIEIPAEVLGKRDIILAYEVDGAACNLRSVVPGERAMYWVKFISTIELYNPVAKLQTEQISLLETAVLACETSDYKYGDSVDKAVTVDELFAKQITETADFVELAAIDGWGKNDQYDLVAAQYIKITGERAPMFIGPELPEGMRLKETLYLKVGSQMLASAKMAQKKLGESIVDGQSGVKLDVFVTGLGLADAPAYIMTGADGYAVSIAKEDIAKGLLYVDEAGANVRFAGLAKNTTVKGLASITAEVV